MQPAWRRIVIATDFSESSDRALALAGWLAGQHGASLVMLHVSDPPANMPIEATLQPPDQPGPLSVERYLTDSSRKRMAAQAGKMIDRIPDEFRVAFGPVAATIASEARGARADLLVLGTHGRTGLSHLLLGSVAERVVRTAPCPVLVVRQPGHEQEADGKTPEEERLEDESQG